MRFTCLLLLCAGLSLGATCRRGATDGTAIGEVADEGATSHDFPVMPGMAHACGESVLGGDGSEIVWDIYSTTEPLETVAAWYDERLGTGGLETTDEKWTWRMPPGAERPERVLSLTPATAWHPECPGLPADAVTIGNFSNMFSRN